MKFIKSRFLRLPLSDFFLKLKWLNRMKEIKELILFCSSLFFV